MEDRQIIDLYWNQSEEAISEARQLQKIPLRMP